MLTRASDQPISEIATNLECAVVVRPSIRYPCRLMGADDQFLYLTTAGRNTGQPREIEIWFVEADGRLYILAEHGYKAQWVKNILSNSRVHIRIRNHGWDGLARVVDPERDAEAYLKARQLAREKYGWGEGLPVEIRKV